ncbi:MAG TPA: hypothetical protein ENJ28_07545 [Gammaproteobacteria bacterium]|nr:hypothetical protein [Gammaproteobacteria bacterium]
MTTHADHKYSVTIHTDDLAVVNCLRALSKYSQRTGNNNIPWGGTKDKNWERDRHHVTFRFSTPEYREGFIAELNRLLPAELWQEVNRSDADPATLAK